MQVANIQLLYIKKYTFPKMRNAYCIIAQILIGAGVYFDFLLCFIVSRSISTLGPYCFNDHSIHVHFIFGYS